MLSGPVARLNQGKAMGYKLTYKSVTCGCGSDFLARRISAKYCPTCIVARKGAYRARPEVIERQKLAHQLRKKRTLAVPRSPEKRLRKKLMQYAHEEALATGESQARILERLGVSP